MHSHVPDRFVEGIRLWALAEDGNQIEGEQTAVLELKVAPSDLGKVIGKQGRTARAMRTLLGAAGIKFYKRFTLEILESGNRESGNRESGNRQEESRG